MLERSLGDGGDLVQLFVERVGWLLRFAEQLRRRKNAFAHHGAGAPPSLIQFTSLARGPWLFGESGGHAPAMFRVDARHRHQVAHGDLRGDLAFAHQLLHGFGQGLHQRQAARHPVPAAVEASREFFNRTTQAVLHLLKQPALFERRFRLAHAQRSFQNQRVGFAHLPHHGIDGVATQLLERGNALVAVDDHIPAAGFDALNNDDGGLLAGFSQRGNQSPLAGRMPHPEVFQAAVQLMKLQLHRLGLQYATARIWSFPAMREVCRKTFVDQGDTP